MKNFPITIKDVKQFNMVYGRNPTIFKGKMTRPSNIDQQIIIVKHETDKYLLLPTDVVYAKTLPSQCRDLFKGVNLPSKSSTSEIDLGAKIRRSHCTLYCTTRISTIILTQQYSICIFAIIDYGDTASDAILKRPSRWLIKVFLNL